MTAYVVTRAEPLENAEKAYEKGDLVSALKLSLDYLGRRPWSREASLIAARCLSRLDYPDQAEPYFHRVGTLSLEDLLIRAYGFVRGNHRERAIAAYEEILDRSPENLTALRLLAGVQMTQRNDPAVLKLAARLIKIPEAASIGYTLRGVTQHNAKIREESVAAFEHVLEIDPELRAMPIPRKIFWSNLAEDLLTLGRTADVKRYIAPVVKNEPDAYLLNSLGRAYYLEGNEAEAERYFREAAELDPKDFASHLNLGRLELHRGHPDEALTQLQQAVALGPRQYDALYALAMAYRRVGRTTEATELEKTLETYREVKAPAPTVAKTPLPRHAL